MRRALVGSVIDRGRETGIETWIERFRRDFCLAPPADLDLALLERVAPCNAAQARAAQTRATI